jgi:hypothetical protein
MHAPLSTVRLFHSGVFATIKHKRITMANTKLVRNKFSIRHLTIACVVCILCAAIGTALLLQSHAATASASIELENGTITSPATVASDSKASGGKYVVYGTKPSGVGSTGASCTSGALSPVAPVSGYTLSGCDDFNTSSSNNFFPYDGGGTNTVVGAGRLPSQCKYTGTSLLESQSSNGATCGGSTNLSQKYGMWEVRMRASFTGAIGSGSSPHPVLILWPDSDVWNDGELDFFDTQLGTPAQGFLHCVGPNISQNCYAIPANSVDYSQYHVYSLLWQNGLMTGYIDGVQWWTTRTSSVMPSVSMHLTMQLDNLTGQTPVRAGNMEVDWMHMYK